MMILVLELYLLAYLYIVELCIEVGVDVLVCFGYWLVCLVCCWSLRIVLLVFCQLCIGWFGEPLGFCLVLGFYTFGVCLVLWCFVLFVSLDFIYFGLGCLETCWLLWFWVLLEIVLLCFVCVLLVFCLDIILLFVVVLLFVCC